MKVIAPLLGAALAMTACGSSSSTASSTATTAAAGSSTGGSSASGGSDSASSNYGLKLNADGTPDLKGVTLHLGISGGNPVPGDTTNYVLAQMLKKWGATVTYTIGGGPSMQLAVVSGQLDAADGQFSSSLDAGLQIIAPAMTHVDDVLVSSKYTSVSQLKGATVATSSNLDPGNYLGGVLSKAQGWGANGLKMTFTGADSSTVDQLISGHLTTAFVAAEDLVTLKAHGTFNVLQTAAQISPDYADSFNAALPSWVKTHQSDVLAIDLGWWAAARIFDTNTAAWDSYAEQYTNNAATPAAVTLQRQALEQFNPWPNTPADASKILSDQVIQTNYAANLAAGQMKGAGLNRSASSMADLGPWQQSAKIAAQYPSIY